MCCRKTALFLLLFGFFFGPLLTGGLLMFLMDYQLDQLFIFIPAALLGMAHFSLLFVLMQTGGPRRVCGGVKREPAVEEERPGVEVFEVIDYQTGRIVKVDGEGRPVAS